MTRTSTDDHPISAVEWVPAETLRANNYNPNAMTESERRLLKISLLEDGWTQPIVARSDGEIVDGFHRWTVAMTDAHVSGMSGGMVPVVRLDSDPVTQRLSTIRHNRARGRHGVLKMGDIVQDLVTVLGAQPEEVAQRLQMEREEVERLGDTRGAAARFAGDGFSDATTFVED